MPRTYIYVLETRLQRPPRFDPNNQGHIYTSLKYDLNNQGIFVWTAKDVYIRPPYIYLQQPKTYIYVIEIVIIEVPLGILSNSKLIYQIKYRFGHAWINFITLIIIFLRDIAIYNCNFTLKIKIKWMNIL